MRTSLVALLAVQAVAAWAGSAAILPENLDQLRKDGFNALFNMQYEEAMDRFEEITRVAPEEPAGPIYLANTVWLQYLASIRRLQTNVYNRRNDSFFDEKAKDSVDPKVDREFQSHLDTGISLAEKMLKTNEKDLKALYYLGIAKNMQAAYEATVKRSFFSALRNGSKGVGLHRKMLQLDPALIDPYLSVGMYEYIVGSLPLPVKIVVFLGGVHGSKKDGLAMLENVANEGNYAKDEAAVLLVMLYNREKRLDDALTMLNRLSGSYPGNFLFRLERAMTMAQLSQLKASSDAFSELLQDAAAMEYMPDLVHYQYAEALAQGKLWKKAHEHYVAAYESEKAPASLKTMAHLESGKCLDALGEREQAVSEYETVLKSRRAFDAQQQAEKFKKKPFRAEKDDG